MMNFIYILLYCALIVILIASALRTIYPFLPIKVQYYIKFSAYLLITGVLCPFFSLVSLFTPRDPKNVDIFAPLLTWFYSFFNIKYNVIDEHNLHSVRGPFIVVCNHQSAIDFIAMIKFWPSNCTALAKMSLLYTTGPYGPLCYLCGTQFIRRGNRPENKRHMAYIANKIKLKNWRVWIFPEGTRHFGEFLPFKKGAFHLAIQAQCPIVPIVISDYRPMYDTSVPMWLPGTVTVQCLEPIYTDKLTSEDVDSLCENVRSSMMDIFSKIKTEV